MANGESSLSEMHIKLEIMPVKYSAKTNFILCQDFEYVFSVFEYTKSYLNFFRSQQRLRNS